MKKRDKVYVETKKYKWHIRHLKRCIRRNNKNKHKQQKQSINALKEDKRKQVVFSAPLKFSIIKNANETCKFLKKLTDFLKTKSTKNVIVFIDLFNVQYMTTDAVMYLLAIICNMKNRTERKISFKGNQPKDAEACKLLQQSGFFRFVKSAATRINQNGNNVQIISGQDVNGEIIKELVEFINRNCFTKIKFTQELYDVFVELMNNTVQHAYDKSEILSERNWYLYASANKEKIKIVFLDTGLGIAETVHRDWGEYFRDIARKDDGYYVESALKGEFRSRTGKKYRGNGLPAVYNYSKRDEVNRFQIHTGKSISKVQNNGELYSKEAEQPLYGVLYYWEIKKEKIGKEYMYD